jgi:hypothetical protein
MGNGSQQIVPWYCHVCGGEFDIPHDGGICAVCLEPTCRSCLWRTFDKDPTTGKRQLRFVCSSCRKSAGAVSRSLEGQR